LKLKSTVGHQKDVLEPWGTLIEPLSNPRNSHFCRRWTSESVGISQIGYFAHCEYFDYMLTLNTMVLATKKPITLPDTEQQQVQALEILLRSGVPVLVSPGGERIELPGTVFEVLRTAVGFMSHGQTITLVPDNQVITTQRAADILGMSRPFFIKQLEGGLMAHHRVGNQRRIYLRDVLEFAKKRDKERLSALDLLARDAFEAGLYERNVFPEGGSDE
jgi:excisionase family DNA binding protein